MSVKFPSGLYKCVTCQEVCAEPEAFEEAKARRVHLEYVVGEAIELMKGYMDTKDGEGYQLPNDAMQAVLLLEEALKAGRKPTPHRFSNRKEVRQQFVPGLKLSDKTETGR